MEAFPSRKCIRRALVLAADHELNSSTFATRVTASTGASLAANLVTGLATLTGPLHGAAVMGTIVVTIPRRGGPVWGHYGGLRLRSEYAAASP